MIRIKNARLCDGRLVSLALANSQFAKVSEQSGWEKPLPSDLSLFAFATESAAGEMGRGKGSVTVDAAGELLAPAGVDVHIHSREPGHTYKEDWQCLAQAAFKGGVVAVVDMPNTSPATMGRAEVVEKAQLAEASGLDFRLMLGVCEANAPLLGALLTDPRLPLAGLKVYYGQSTGNLRFADLEELHRQLPLELPGRLVFHSEDQCRIDRRYERLSSELARDTTPGGYGVHSHIRDSESAWLSTQVILDWAARWQRPVHIAHVSTPREVELIEAARQAGGEITCEVAPHHILLSSADYERLGGFLKVNPPVRSPDEVARLRQEWRAGRLNCFATDHAPHSKAEKGMPYDACPSGLPSLELFWPLFATCVRESGQVLAEGLAMATSEPARLFGFSDLGRIAAGARASFVWLREEPFVVEAQSLVAKCGWSPYEGQELAVQVKATWHNGRCVYVDRS